jgi:predicted Zn-dependent protease
VRRAGKGAAFLFLAALAACATTDLSPHAGTRLDLLEDEKRIWVEAAEAEEQIDRSGMIEDVPEFTEYAGEVTRKLFPDLPFSRSVRVVRESSLNAFALPNGAIYIHTGFLARMENEAQLATLLGHEMAHATHRHALRERRKLENVSAIYAAITLGGAAGGLFTIASVTGYSRDLEREADGEGFRRMVAAGYEPSEAPELFRILERWLRETGARDPYFFSSHPKVVDRIESFQALAAADPRKGTGTDRRDIFRSKTRWAVLESAEIDLKEGRFESALRGADKYLGIAQDDARGFFLRGEVLRQRNAGDDVEQSVGWYRKAIAASAGYPEPYRALGLIQYKKGEKAEARQNLEKYLALKPGAPDRSYVEGYIRALR